MEDLAHPGEEGDVMDVRGHQGAHMAGNHGHLPPGNAQVFHEPSGVVASQGLDLMIGDSLEAVLRGELVDDTHEPRKRIRQGSIEVEDDEPVLHACPPWR
ncbi:hypothetical protein D3C72_2152650 [compost metagenome]